MSAAVRISSLSEMLDLQYGHPFVPIITYKFKLRIDGNTLFKANTPLSGSKNLMILFVTCP